VKILPLPTVISPYITGIIFYNIVENILRTSHRTYGIRKLRP